MDTTGRKMVRTASRPEVAKPPRRMRGITEKRAIVEETLEPGASVAVVARAHEVNANLVFGWRKLYRQGLLEPQAEETPASLLPVKLAHSPRAHPREASNSGVMEIELASGDRLHLHGRVDLRELSQVIEILRRR